MNTTYFVLANNATFNSLAMDLADSLPSGPDLPLDLAEANRWQQAGRDALNNIIRSDRADYRLVAEQQDSFTRDGVRVAYWRLKIGGDWTVPVTEIAPPGAESTAIVISDAGRSSCSLTVNRLIAENKRVLAVDPFYFGESKVSQDGFLFAFMIATIGHRPFGVQANQVAAVARWSRETHDEHAVTLIAEGPRTSIIALISAAVEVRRVLVTSLYIREIKQIVK